MGKGLFVFQKRAVRFLENTKAFSCDRTCVFLPLSLHHGNQSCLVKLSELSSRKITDLRHENCNCPFCSVYTCNKNITHMQYFPNAGISIHRHPTDTGCRSLVVYVSKHYVLLPIPHQKRKHSFLSTSSLTLTLKSPAFLHYRYRS